MWAEIRRDVRQAFQTIAGSRQDLMICGQSTELRLRKRARQRIGAHGSSERGGTAGGVDQQHTAAGDVVVQRADLFVIEADFAGAR